MRNLTETENLLMGELRNIYNNRDFVVGVMSDIPGKKEQNIMLDFISTAKKRGDKITSEHLICLAIALKRKKNRKE